MAAWQGVHIVALDAIEADGALHGGISLSALVFFTPQLAKKKLEPKVAQAYRYQVQHVMEQRCIYVCMPSTLMASMSGDRVGPHGQHVMCMSRKS